MNTTICLIDAWNIFLWRQFFFLEIGEKSESFPNLRPSYTPQNFSVAGLLPHSVRAVHGWASVERIQPRAWSSSLVVQRKKTETAGSLLFFYLSPVIVDTTAAPALYVFRLSSILGL